MKKLVESKRKLLAPFVAAALTLPFMALGRPQSLGPQSPFITGENETMAKRERLNNQGANKTLHSDAVNRVRERRRWHGESI